MHSEEYTYFLQNLQKFKSIGTEPRKNDLDILEIFAQKESFTVTDITSAIKSTKREKAYKNVHCAVQRLRSLSLIEKIDSIERRRHNEKYFKLTDDGIFQLFKSRVDGILVDQLSILKGHGSVSYVDRFFCNYSNCLLLKLFLYPYFEKRPKLENFDLLERLCRYFHECCTKIDAIIRICKVTPDLIPRFSWDKIPGQDNSDLLASLRNIFELQEWDKETVNISKTPDNNIIISAPNLHIEIRLDLPSSKAISTLRNNIDHNKVVQTYEYRLIKLAYGIIVCSIEPASYSLIDALENARLLESIFSAFCDLVSWYIPR